MADVFPSSLIYRENPNLRLGIKSSLNSFKQLLASLYIIYKSCANPSNVLFSEEVNVGDNIAICLSKKLLVRINELFPQLPNLQDRINQSPLFKSQCESLQVGLELFLHLGKIDFVENGKQERKGENRYNKMLAFSDKMLVLDAYLSMQAEYTDLLLNNWLNGDECGDKFEDGLKSILSTFIIDCCYKIKKTDGSEVVFNLENICKVLEKGDSVLFKSAEIVGPLRVLNSYIGENMLPDIVKGKGVYCVDNLENLKRKAPMVSTSLDLVVRKLPGQVDNQENSQKPPVNQSEINQTYRPYITAIKSKPFLLLAGISGTGKSRIVRELARACWGVDSPEYKDHKPKNFEMIQVKPNWHDSSELIGYVSRLGDEPTFIAGDFLKFVVRAWENESTPYFLCLDEMNLAPVEQYFAEYLSVVESRKCNETGKVVTDPILKPEFEKERNGEHAEFVPKAWYKKLIDELLVDCSDSQKDVLKQQFIDEGITIPQNLIIVGTVNMDETTFSFSRKVLDRAMTIEMNEVDLYGGLTSRHEQIGKLNFEDLVGDKVEGVDVYQENQEVCNQAILYLQEINAVLEGTPFKIAYRTRNEFLLYVVNNLPYRKNSQGLEMTQNEVVARALDEITSMKILSRIEGDEEKVKAELLASLKEVVSKMLPENMRDSSVSLAKLDEMEKKLSSGYTSFWS